MTLRTQRIRALVGSIAALSLTGGGAAEAEEGQGFAGNAYGHSLPIPLPFLRDRIGIGANLKMMRGTTYFHHIRYDSADDLLDEITDGHNARNSYDWGLDLGLMVRAADWRSTVASSWAGLPGRPRRRVG